MSSSSTSIWLHILNIACVALPIVAFASPGTVFIPIFCCGDSSSLDDDNGGGRRQRRDVVIEMPPLALTSQMLQCYLFAIYALHMQMITLLIPNTIGFVLGFIWSTLYPLKMLAEEEVSWKWQYFTSLIIMAVGTYYSFMQDNPYVASTIAAGVGVIMCTYPLPSMKKAFQQSNPEFMGSVQMNCAMFACCTSWVIHSSPLVELDGFVLISNGAGVLVQGSALLLRAYILTTTRRRSLPSEEDNINHNHLLLDHKKNGGSSALFLSNRSSKSGDGLFVKDSLRRSSYEEYDTEAYKCPTNFGTNEHLSSEHNMEHNRCRTCGGCLQQQLSPKQTTNPPTVHEQNQKRNLSFKDLFLESYQDVVDVDTIPSREDEEPQGCGGGRRYSYYNSLCCCRNSTAAASSETQTTTRSKTPHEEVPQQQKTSNKICICDNSTTRNQNDEETPLLNLPT